MLTEARRRFPDAEFRILSLPRKAGEPISLRMRQQAEWLPNGRSTLWFDAATGRVLGARNALAMAPGAQAFNKAFPKIGRAHVCTPVTNAHIVCRLLLEKEHQSIMQHSHYDVYLTNKHRTD